MGNPQLWITCGQVWILLFITGFMAGFKHLTHKITTVFVGMFVRVDLRFYPLPTG